MGFLSKLVGLFSKKQKARILVVGLDNSGKTTVINWLKPKKTAVVDVVPTVGFSVENFQKNNIAFTVFDMSGQGKYRSLWEHYFKETDAIIFVLDTSDKVRMCVAKDELETMLTHESVKDIPIPVLFFANKQDLPGAAQAVECVNALELDVTVAGKPWHIQPSNALTGDGLEDGMNWLSNQLKDAAA